MLLDPLPLPGFNFFKAFGSVNASASASASLLKDDHFGGSIDILLVHQGKCLLGQNFSGDSLRTERVGSSHIGFHLLG